MNKQSELAWLIEQSKDEVYSFNNLIHRPVAYESTATFHGYIVQHAHYYFSPLNQIYLFLLNDLASLSLFDKVFVRDGLLTLKIFFLRNPSPLGLQTKLIINSRFASFIPKNWQNNVYYYNYKLTEKKKSKRSFLILAYHTDPLHCPDEILESVLEHTETDSYDEILCLVTGMPQYGAADFVDKNIFNKAAITARKIKKELRTVTINEITPRMLANSDFLEINPYHFLFSDCFLRWHLLYNGANPIAKNWLSETIKSGSIHEMAVSPYHSIEILKPLVKTEEEQQGLIETEFFAEDINPSRNHLINLCSDGYKRYVHSLVKKNADINH